MFNVVLLLRNYTDEHGANHAARGVFSKLSIKVLAGNQGYSRKFFVFEERFDVRGRNQTVLLNLIDVGQSLTRVNWEQFG
jgi:hypothetical protein